jgi:hypothetical protein
MRIWPCQIQSRRGIQFQRVQVLSSLLVEVELRFTLELHHILGIYIFTSLIAQHEFQRHVLVHQTPDYKTTCETYQTDKRLEPVSSIMPWFYLGPREAGKACDIGPTSETIVGCQEVLFLGRIADFRFLSLVQETMLA